MLLATQLLLQESIALSCKKVLLVLPHRHGPYFKFVCHTSASCNVAWNFISRLLGNTTLTTQSAFRKISLVYVATLTSSSLGASFLRTVSKHRFVVDNIATLWSAKRNGQQKGKKDRRPCSLSKWVKSFFLVCILLRALDRCLSAALVSSSLEKPIVSEIMSAPRIACTGKFDTNVTSG